MCYLGVITNFQEYRSVTACLVHLVLIIDLTDRDHLHTDKITSLHSPLQDVRYHPDVWIISPQPAFR